LPQKARRWGNIITPHRFGKGFLQGMCISLGSGGFFA
jgi:hypothetical protein